MGFLGTKSLSPKCLVLSARRFLFDLIYLYKAKGASLFRGSRDAVPRAILKSPSQIFKSAFQNMRTSSMKYLLEVQAKTAGICNYKATRYGSPCGNPWKVQSRIALLQVAHSYVPICLQCARLVAQQGGIWKNQQGELPHAGSGTAIQSGTSESLTTAGSEQSGTAVISLQDRALAKQIAELRKENAEMREMLLDLIKLVERSSGFAIADNGEIKKIESE
jgi:hypothetical protein